MANGSAMCHRTCEVLTAEQQNSRKINPINDIPQTTLRKSRAPWTAAGPSSRRPKGHQGRGASPRAFDRNGECAGAGGDGDGGEDEAAASAVRFSVFSFVEYFMAIGFDFDFCFSFGFVSG